MGMSALHPLAKVVLAAGVVMLLGVAALSYKAKSELDQIDADLDAIMRIGR
jgi:hypothetical protein